MHNHTHRRMFRFECLERRAMLTGTVNIAYIGSSSQAATLFISGDNAANAIAIRQVPSSGGVPRIEIQGINTKLVATTSGAATPSQTGTSFTFAASDILVAMGGGNDSLAITNLKLPGTLTIDMGAGNDRLTMTSVQFQAPSLVFTCVADGHNNRATRAVPNQ